MYWCSLPETGKFTTLFWFSSLFLADPRYQSDSSVISDDRKWDLFQSISALIYWFVIVVSINVSVKKIWLRTTSLEDSCTKSISVKISSLPQIYDENNKKDNLPWWDMK